MLLLNKSKLSDQDSRKEALDLSKSFIIQAPAGSGKTELLIQRYLKLLSISQQPEEVVAITARPQNSPMLLFGKVLNLRLRISRFLGRI